MKSTFPLLLASLVLPACVNESPLGDKPCPCAAGYVCCDGTNRCVASLELCAVRSVTDAGSTDTQVAPPVKDASSVDAQTILAPEDAGRTPSDPVAPSQPVPCETAAVADMFGTWSGYGENAEFDDGTDGVSVTLSCQPGVGVVGTLRVGRRAEPPFAPPGSADVAYPTAAEVSQTNDWQTGYMRLQELPTAGVAYSLLAVEVDGARLRFKADHNELWREWCELQVPGATGARGSTPKDERDFLLNWLSVCTCDALSCGADLGLAYEFRTLAFDLSFSANRADGSGLWETDHSSRTSHNVHLTRQ